MKTLTVKDKEDFKRINEVLATLDDEAQAYLMGYSQGLSEGRSLPLRRGGNSEKRTK